MSFLAADGRLMTRAKANSGGQFLESPDLTDAIIDAVEGNQGSHNRLADYFYGDNPDRADLVSKIGTLVHMYASDQSQA